jgi:hypothetical protein
MQRECESTERDDVWGVFEARVIGPCIRCEKPMPYQELVERYNLATPRQASNVLNTGKRLFARILRAVVCEYTPENEVDAEIQDLKLALSGDDRTESGS